MSILNNNSPPKLDLAETIAQQLINQTKNTFDVMSSSFNNGSNNFWNHPIVPPSAIAQALGTNAREVFQLHYALGQLIIGVKPESIEKGLSVIGQFTMNEDGTVTILPPSGNP